ncbi:hypothetical protein RN001_002916 [Aquatica leii]|uniref:Uncharacterized protein n=1 Tax=Aquatica leii TaxID=1421715 RepID=A0AAN7PE76_9COLE|nr:hypothetical protein RN001_002916 [Aquatica leii]
MNAFIVVLSCLAVFAKASPSGLWAHGHHGHLPLVGASGVVSGHGAAGPAGVVTGHGAIGPHGDHNAVGHVGHIAHIGHVGHVLAHGHDDGQWHGEGLLESQDWAGHHHGIHGAVIAQHAAVIAPAAHGLVLGHGIAHAHGLAHGHGLAYAHGYGHDLGHGAVVAGPAGTIVAHGHHGAIISHHHGHW